MKMHRPIENPISISLRKMQYEGQLHIYIYIYIYIYMLINIHAATRESSFFYSHKQLYFTPRKASTWPWPHLEIGLGKTHH